MMQPLGHWKYFLGNEPEMQKEENSLKYVGHFILHFLGLFSNLSTSRKLKNVEIGGGLTRSTQTPETPALALS